MTNDVLRLEDSIDHADGRVWILWSEQPAPPEADSFLVLEQFQSEQDVVSDNPGCRVRYSREDLRLMSRWLQEYLDR